MGILKTSIARWMHRFVMETKRAAWVIVLGAASGLACVGVRSVFRGLQWAFTQYTGMLPQAAAGLSFGRRAITPAIGAICASIIAWTVRKRHRVAPFREYVEAVRFDDGRIPFASTLWRSVASAFSIATGAAIGREGTMIQFAAAVTSWVGERSPVRDLRLSRQVAYGTAAAVAAAYQAPLGGIFFAMEIVLGELAWKELPLLGLASVAGWLVSRTILGGGPLFAVSVDLAWTSTALLCAVPFGALLGVLGPIYQAMIRSLRFAKRWPLALVWSGLLVGGLSILQTKVWGNGDAALLSVLHSSVAWQGALSILVVRLLATAFCVGTGTVGGVFTPTLFAGAAVGLVAGHILHLSDPVLFAVIGLGCLLSAVTHAPWMASFMAVELTGQWHLLPAILVCNVVAWKVACAVSSQSLYAIASPEPATEATL